MSKQEEIKIGDNVHVGMRQKGGAGISGTVTKIDGDRVHIKGHHDGKTYRGALEFTMKESEEFTDIEELDETVFDKQKFVVHYTSSSDGKRHRRTEESWGPAGIVRKMEMVGHKVHDITHNGESVMHVARKVLDARMNEAYGDEDHIQQTLADRDINSKIDGNTVVVHKSNVAKTKQILKKMGHNHEVRGGLNESFDFGIPSFSEFLSEMTGEPTIEECYAMAVEDFLMSEEFEQLDEISKKTLGSYIRQASRSASELSSDSTERFYQSKGDESRGLKRNAELKRDDSDALLDKSLRRQRGIDRAVARLTKEEFEQLDELSKGTLARYVRRAVSDVENQSHVRSKKLDSWASGRSGRDSYKDVQKLDDKIDKRKDGIDRAVGKLARESEQIDELSPYTLASYITQASLDLDKQSRNQGRKIAKGEPGEEEQERGNKRIKGIVKAGYKLARKANRNQN